MSSYTIAMSFAMGLTGSLHCAGMCGPIIWVMPFAREDGVRKWAGVLLYHFGRISVYALAGWILYSFTIVFQPRWQQYISIGLGLLLLCSGVLAFLPRGGMKVKLPWTGWVQKRLGHMMGYPGIGTLFFAGMMNGLLPCGLVYMALSVAVTAPAAVDAVVLMYVFGAGTMPVLLALTFFKNRISFLNALPVRKLVPLFLFLFGGLFIVRGMNLGIPYLSPAIAVEGQAIHANCCHKP